MSHINSPELVKELTQDLNILVDAKQDFEKENSDFQSKWRPRCQTFVEYMGRTWLNPESLHPPKYWNVENIGPVPHPDLTNNQSEIYHSKMQNRLPVATVKNLIRTIQEIELENRVGHIFNKLHVEFDQKISEDGQILNISSSSQASKRFLFSKQNSKKAQDSRKRTIDKRSPQKETQEKKRKKKEDEEYEPQEKEDSEDEELDENFENFEKEDSGEADEKMNKLSVEEENLKQQPTRRKRKSYQQKVQEELLQNPSK